MSKPPFPIVKAFAIGGLILAEIYMLLVMLAPNLAGQAVPWTHVIKRIAIGAIFFGPFGLAVGTGVGLLAAAVIQKMHPSPRTGRDITKPEA